MADNQRFVNIYAKGDTEAIAALDNLIRELPGVVALALHEEAESINSEAGSLTPVDTGSLLMSRFVDPPVIEPNRVSVSGGYGKSMAQINPKTNEMTTEYAIIVHDDLYAKKHTRYPHGGEPKFLAKTVRKRAFNIISRIVQRVDRILGEMRNW